VSRMFRTGRTVHAIAFLTALCGVSAAGLAASPSDRDHNRSRWGHSQRGSGHGGFVIRVETAPVIISRPRPQVVIAQPVAVCDVVPSDLRYAAYQSQDRIIVIISGTNRAAGFTTTLTAVEGHEWSPTLVMRNMAPSYECAGSAAFSLNAAICSKRALGCVRLKIADQVFEVPVTAVPSLS
jgi:hypothetical protein